MSTQRVLLKKKKPDEWTGPGPEPFARRRRIVIPCPKGVPPFLKEEIRALGYPIIVESTASVETEGTLEDTLRLNLSLRTGHRVLYSLEDFAAKDADGLYAGISWVAWEDYIPEKEYLCVTSSVNNPTIRDFRYVNVKCKDAVVDRLRRIWGRRPDSGPERTGVVIDLYWQGDRCRVYLDTSGEPLPRRGYRRIPLQAPMQETLAAAVILASGWRGQGNFINPMCGSGTLAIEAALIALDQAPGLLRENFGFMHLRGFKEAVWQKLRAEAGRRIKKQLDGKIIATDINPRAVQAARQNAAAAGVGEFIDFGTSDFAATPVPEGGGVVMLNPEYGSRMGKVEELAETYKGIGDFFKQRCRGYRGYIFTGNPDLAKKVGLKAKRRVPFFNSNIECRLLEYELYEGSRKS